MTRYARHLRWLSLLSLLLPLYSFGYTFTTQLTFDASEVETWESTHNGVTYSSFSYDDMYSFGEPGAPALPAKVITLQIPLNAIDITYSVQLSNDETFDVNLVLPQQMPYATDGSAAPDFTLPDDNIYQSGDNYPSVSHSVQHDGLYLGYKRMINLAVYPFVYKPQKAEVHFYQNATITVSYNLTNDILSASPYPPVVPRYVENDFTSNQPNRARRIRGHNFYNPKLINMLPDSLYDFQIKQQLEALIPPTLPNSADTLRGYYYTIVTSDVLAPAFERLVALRRMKGYETGIVTMSQIINSGMFDNGDEMSNICDSAGMLRQFIKYAYENFGTQYVLLGGKPPHVPIRYAYTYNGYTPTDFYFAELNSNWHQDNTDKYGKFAFNIDTYAEVFVGRLLCKSQDEINNYIDKLENYELNPGAGSPQYLGKALLTYQKNRNYTTWNGLIDAYSNLTDTLIFRKYQDGTPTGTEFINFINNVGPFGIVSIHTHGNPCGIDLSSNDSIGTAGLLAQSGISLHNCYNLNISSGVEEINSFNKPYIEYSIACETTPFDIYIDKNDNIYNVEYNYGESVTLAGKYGCVAYMGNTRAGVPPNSEEFEINFINSLSHSSCTLSQNYYSSKSQKGIIHVAYHHNFLTHNYLGDPIICMWKGIPFSPLICQSNAFITDGYTAFGGSDLSTLTAGVNPVNGAKPYLLGFSSDAIYYDDMPPNSVITLYSNSMMPKILPLNIQNETFSNTNCVYANELYLGSSIIDHRQVGDVIFNNHSEYTFITKGDVHIYNGVRLRPNSKLNIISEGEVHIHNNINMGFHSEINIICRAFISTGFHAPIGTILNVIVKPEK